MYMLNFPKSPKLGIPGRQHINRLNTSSAGVRFSSDKVIMNMLGKPKGASIAKQQQWKGFSAMKKRVEPMLHLDYDNDGVPNRWDCRPMNPKRQGFFHRKTEYVTPEEYQRAVLQKPSNIQTYGEVQRIPGKTVGNALIAAGVAIPVIVPAPIITPVGMYIRSKVDNVKLTKTDEHDRRYKIPRVSLE